MNLTSRALMLVICPAILLAFRPLSSVKAASIPPGKGMLADCMVSLAASGFGI